MFLPKSVKIVIPTLKKMLHIPEVQPKFVQISFTNYCNLSCRMCVRNYIKVEQRHMEWDDFIVIVDKIKGAEQVALAGMGESLLHPRIFDAIKYCKDRGLKVQLTSNALLLKEDDVIEKIIGSGLDTISFSLESVSNNCDVGHGNKTAVQNIERLIRRKKELGVSKPKTVIQPILFKDKVKDICEIVAWAADVGVDRINVVRVDLRFVKSMQRPSVEEEKKIFKQFAVLRKKHGVRIDCLQDQVFVGFPGLFFKYAKKLLRLDTWCYRLQDFIYVNVNGDVHPCCLDEQQIMGNLLKQSLDEIWFGKKFKYIRKSQEDFAYCQKCDFLRLKQVTR